MTITERSRGAIFFFVVLCLLLSASVASADTLDRIKQRGYILWGADAEGGAPYIFPDPKNPAKMIGFEVDLAQAIAHEMGVAARQSQNAWDSLIPALERGDFDMAMNGIEITSQRKERVLFTNPYYVYTEQLVVRKDETRISDLNSLKGMKVGTLSGTVAQTMLERNGGIDVKIYSGQVEPYEDLAIGRIDAVLLDLPIAAYYAKPNPKLRFEGKPMGEGFYGIALRKGDDALLKKLNEILSRLLRNGELKRIYEKWGLWTPEQEKLFASMSDTGYVGLEQSKKAPLYSFLPTLCGAPQQRLSYLLYPCLSQ